MGAQVTPLKAQNLFSRCRRRGREPLVGEAIAQVSAAELKPTGGIGLGHQGEGGEGTQVSLQATDLAIQRGEAIV